MAIDDSTVHSPTPSPTPRRSGPIGVVRATERPPEPPPPAAGIRRRITTPIDFGSVLTDLYNVAKDRLSGEDLEQLAGLADLASGAARHLAMTCERIGCLVADEGGAKTGYFQSEQDVPSLLFWIADTAAMINHSVWVAGEAAHALQESSD